jgi:hypothetical protein
VSTAYPWNPDQFCKCACRKSHVDGGGMFLRNVYFKILPWNFPGQTDENHEKPLYVQHVVFPRFEPCIARLQ